MRRRDLAALIGIAALAAALTAFDRLAYQPRDVSLACLHGAAPALLCAARGAVAWSARNAVFATAAVALGIAAIVSRRAAIAVAAICAGIAGMVFYNVSWGVTGAAMGAWSWLGGVRAETGSGQRDARAEQGR